VEILICLLVTVVLAETRDLKLVIGRFSHLFPGLDESKSIGRSTVLEGFLVVYNKLENNFIGETRA